MSPFKDTPPPYAKFWRRTWLHYVQNSILSTKSMRAHPKVDPTTAPPGICDDPGILKLKLFATQAEYDIEIFLLFINGSCFYTFLQI